MTRRLVSSVLLIVASTAGAQIVPRGPRVPGLGIPDPNYWVGVSLGYFWVPGDVTDAKTNATWSFGYSAQLAATFEKTVQRNVAVGVLAGFASPNLTYSSASVPSTTARADVTQLMATARLGTGGYGTRSSFLLSLGGIQYHNFRDITTSAKLPGDTWDPAFGTGYTFGLALAPVTDVYFESDWMFILHSQGNTVQRFPPQTFVFKIGFKQGF